MLQTTEALKSSQESGWKIFEELVQGEGFFGLMASYNL
jgi:hypothetical protein